MPFLHWWVKRLGISRASTKGTAFTGLMLLLFLCCRHHILVIPFSILFAETFPSWWEAEGKARTVLNEFWKFGAMFIVLIYLCNLRSHLIKGIKERPIQSFQELLKSDFAFTQHDGERNRLDPFMKPKVAQGKLFTNKGFLLSVFAIHVFTVLLLIIPFMIHIELYRVCSSSTVSTFSEKWKWGFMWKQPFYFFGMRTAEKHSLQSFNS